MEKKDHEKNIDNRHARHKYFILNSVEAGIELKGCEVKSIREGRVQLREGYAHVKNLELFLEGVHINSYSHAGFAIPDPMRTRKLLLHRREIIHLANEVSQKNLVLIPLKLYFQKGRVKLALGIAKPKKVYDKRESIKDRETKRMLDRTHKKKHHKST